MQFPRPEGFFVEKPPTCEAKPFGSGLDKKTKSAKIVVVDTGETTTVEFNVVIDGVIEIEDGIDAKEFFDGLLDVLIEYVEKHNAKAGLSMSYKEYEEPEDDH